MTVMATDTPRLMGAGEIGKRLGVCRQRVHQLVTEPDFPEPVVWLSMGKVWAAEDVERWIGEYRPQAAGRAA